jgi:F-type H+-transporting ATPase subunit delta
MKDYLLALRYASALVQSIGDNAQLEPAADSLKGIARLFARNHALHSALSTPSIDVERRVEVMNQVLGNDVPPLVMRFCDLLLRRQRIAILPAAAQVFSTLVDKRLGRVTAQVTTAIELDETHSAKLTEALSKFSDKTVRMDCTVDPEILGGAIARMDGVLIDGSVRNRLERLRAALLAEEN